LPGLLPEHHKLVLNTHHYGQAFILTLINSQACELIAQQVLSELEMYVTIALVEAYPHYATYEVLLGAVSDRTMTHIESIIRKAQEGQELDVLLAPLRNTLKRCRRRLHAFGIDIGSVRGLGYALYRIEPRT
jgi:hypothetical protein